MRVAVIAVGLLAPLALAHDGGRVPARQADDHQGKLEQIPDGDRDDLRVLQAPLDGVVCCNGEPAFDSSNTDGQTGSGTGAVAYTSGGRDVRTTKKPDPRIFLTGYGGWEPTLGLTKDGTIIYAARNSNADPEPLRSSDGGRTWRAVPPTIAGVRSHQTSLDPYLWLDSSTGRVFDSDVDPTIVCTPVSTSDDGGATWSESRACGVADHQTIFGGPPPEGAAQPAGYPNVVYYCAIAGGATGAASTTSECLKSLDGGKTWGATGDPAYPAKPGPDGFCNGALGHGVVGPDGTAYLPRGWCGPPYLAISHDEGATWTRVQVSDREQNPNAHEAGIAADRDGNLYYVWVAQDGHPYLVISRDGGNTWAAARDLLPPGVARVGSFAAHVDVGDPGRIATVFMGTRDAQPSDESRWNAYIIISADALADDPLFYAGQVNADSNVLHQGSSCCGNVGDFLDVVVGPDGEAYAALVDTCPGKENACTDFTVTTPRGEAILGRLVGGPSLREADAD